MRKYGILKFFEILDLKVKIFLIQYPPLQYNADNGSLNDLTGSLLPGTSVDMPSFGLNFVAIHTA